MRTELSQTQLTMRQKNTLHKVQLNIHYLILVLLPANYDTFVWVYISFYISYN